MCESDADEISQDPEPEPDTKSLTVKGWVSRGAWLGRMGFCCICKGQALLFAACMVFRQINAKLF